MSSQPPNMPPMPSGPGLVIERSQPSLRELDAPPALYVNGLATQATEEDITLDWVFNHPQTGPTIGARTSMTWAMFDQLASVIERVQANRARMMQASEQGQPPAGANGAT